MSEYMDSFRDGPPFEETGDSLCWFLLNGGTRACIKERGHDRGAHEGAKDLQCNGIDAHDAHTWTVTYQCVGGE